MLQKIMPLMAFLCSFWALTFPSQAGVDSSKDASKESPAACSSFAKGTTEFQAEAGAFFSFSTSKAHRGVIDYQLEVLRLGRMLNDPHFTGFSRGNSELLLEAFGGPVYHGPGNLLVGGALDYRYNFVQPGSKFVPFFQVGAGGLYNDIYRYQQQRLVGEG